MVSYKKEYLFKFICAVTEANCYHYPSLTVQRVKHFGE